MLSLPAFIKAEMKILVFLNLINVIKIDIGSFCIVERKVCINLT